VLFPGASVHPALRLTIWSDTVRRIRALGLLSHAELPVVRAYLGPTLPPEEVVGVGVDASQQPSYPRHQQDPADDPARDDELPGDREEAEDGPDGAERGLLFRRRHRLYGALAVYGGRVDTDNGSEEVLEYFDSYAAVDPALSLVLTGVKMMKVPEADYVSIAGVLQDREQPWAYEAADVTLAPEPDDLLAMPVLQSFAAGAPVLASARNRAAVDHCRRGQGGMYYETRAEFVEALRLLASSPGLRKRLGENGRQYVRQHYRWDAVLGRFERLIGRVRS
jgi:glycosyltransferase involved in cell wall biosynthesis